MAERRRALLLLDPSKQRAGIEMPYDIQAMMMIFTVFIVGVFYCLDALHGERRDRSILFWKSLPVSDLTTVLSKAIVPLAILPVIAFALTVCVQVIMLLHTGVVLLFHGMNPATTWTQVPWFQNWLVLAYGLVTIALWHAPIYGWLLLVSGWARRATFLWAVLPFIVIQIFEKITFGTSYCGQMLKPSFDGVRAARFWFPPRWPSHDRLSVPTHSGKVPEQRRSLARSAFRGGIRGRRGSAPPLSGADLEKS